MSLGAIKFQIGKAGITPAVVEQINRMLEYHKHIRISALPSSGRNHDSIKTIAETLAARLKVPCEYRVIGFTIALRRSSEKGGRSLRRLKDLTGKSKVYKGPRALIPTY